MHIPFDVSVSSMARNFFAISSSSLTSASLISSEKSIFRFFNFRELLTPHASDADRLIVADDDGVFSTMAAFAIVIVVGVAVSVVVVTLLSYDFDDFKFDMVSESFVWLVPPMFPLDSHSLKDCDDPDTEYADTVDAKLSSLLNVHSEFG